MATQQQLTSTLMESLTDFQRDAMFVIAGQDRPHGLQVKADLEDYLETEVNHGRLYPNLDTLVDMGLVEKGSKDRRTNYYVLTDKGEQTLAERIEWQDEQLSDDSADADGEQAGGAVHS